MSSKERGQTLIELVVVISVIALVVGSLVFATIASLRNAQFSKNQAQATKLAQEGLEKVRSSRDRDGSVYYIRSIPPPATHFNELWTISFNCTSSNNCQFFFDSTGVLVGGNAFEDISPNFKRQIIIEDEGVNSDSKKVTVVVQWNDSAGSHESRLTTILRKL